jgi:hypothetical protein
MAQNITAFGKYLCDSFGYFRRALSAMLSRTFNGRQWSIYGQDSLAKSSMCREFTIDFWLRV